MITINVMNNLSNQTNTQNETMLVWLDFGPTAYINFGIASALSKIELFLAKKMPIFFKINK